MKLYYLYFCLFLSIFILSSCDTAKKDTSTTSQIENNLTDWEWIPFIKIDSLNPILHPSTDLEFICPIRSTSVLWEEKDVFNPAAIVKDGAVYLIYRAEDVIGKYNGTSRLGLAVSNDGLHFEKMKTPILFPDNDDLKNYEWEGGCEDPRIVEDENGTYYLTYTAYDGDKARLFIATSTDLINWEKHGSIFLNAENGKYVDYWTKAGAIITKEKDGKLIAAKINGKYWMYFGESNIYVATSDNLIDWIPMKETDESKKQYDTLRGYEAFKIIFAPRKGKFDSFLVEPGPPPVLTENGVLFIYNSKNDPEHGDMSLPTGTYAAGQVLLNPEDPSEVLARSEYNFFRPEEPYEMVGQVDNVNFLEGLVYFNNQWLLYYGTADSKIAVAVYSK